MRRRMKKTTRQYIAVAFICIFVIGGAAAATTYVMTDSVKDKYELKLQAAYTEMDENQRDVYVAAADIMPGDPITEDNAALSHVYSGQPQEVFITEEDYGKVALIKLPIGTQLTKGMLSEYKLDKEAREMQYDVILINSNILTNDTVDVRIAYPNGENYVVLSKKVIRDYVPGEVSCYFWLNEAEILRMSAAIVDASMYSGTTLTVAKYVEPSIQEESEVTYTPSLSVLSLLESDPNVLERSSQALAKDVRKALENRLALSSQEDVTQADWEVPNDTYIGADRNAGSNTDETTAEPIVTPTPSPVLQEEDSLPETGSNIDDSGDLGSSGKESMGELGLADNYLFYAQDRAGKGGH